MGKMKRCGKITIRASLKLETAIIDWLKISGKFEESGRVIRTMSGNLKIRILN